MHLILRKAQYSPGENTLTIEGNRDELRFCGVDRPCGENAARWLQRHINLNIKVNFICNGPECILVLEDDHLDRLTILSRL